MKVVDRLSVSLVLIYSNMYVSTSSPPNPKLTPRVFRRVGGHSVEEN